MKGIHHTTNPLIKLVNKNESKIVDVFYWIFIVLFIIDRTINYFFHFPFFVGSAIIIFPFLVLTTQYKNPDKWKLNVLILAFVCLGILNSVFYFFDVKNISDLLFIILLFTIYFYYRDNIKYLKIRNIYILFLMSFILFFFTFFNVNTSAIIPSKYHSAVNCNTNTVVVSQTVSETKPLKQIDNTTSSLQVSKIEQLPQKKLPQEEMMSEARGSIKWKSNPQDRNEERRNYHSGLFRVPQVASYFFGFLFLFFAYQYQKTKRIIDLILFCIALFLCLYTSTRIILVTFAVSIFLFFIHRKYYTFLLFFVLGLVILVITNDFFITITNDTFLNQYFVFIETCVENFTRLSRFRLWYSWWIAMSEFDFWNLLIGKSFISSYIVNDKNLGYYIWFHNDFLSILYSYGVIGLTLYIAFFIKIYRDNKILIKQNIFVFIFFHSIILTAFFNGFYYYFPIFLLYIFFLMIKNEKQLAQ